MNERTCSTEAAAKKIGVSRQTLHSWIEAGNIVAPMSVDLGKKRSILLWTESEIESAQRFKGTLKRGPKRQKKKR
jgi:predicted DNA-binding transcriptional regulator AlpA